MLMFVFSRDCEQRIEMLLSCTSPFFDTGAAQECTTREKPVLDLGLHPRHSLYDLAGIPFSIWTDVDPVFDFNQSSLYPCELFYPGEAVSDNKHRGAATCPLSHQPPHHSCSKSSTHCAPGLNPLTCMRKGLSLHGGTSEAKSTCTAAGKLLYLFI